MDKKTKGAWLVHHTSKLQKVDTQANYENIFLAGKSGILLSSISASRQNTLTNKKLETLAQAANISIKFELPELLKTLSKHGLVEISPSGVDVLGITGSATLDHVSDIFEHSNPSISESAALEISEISSIHPQEKKDIHTNISDIFSIDSRSANELFSDSEKIGFVDVEKIDDQHCIYFNGNLFRREETRKINAVLSSLSSAEQTKLNEFNDMIQKTACISVQDAQKRLGDQLFSKISAIGLYDINVVSNNHEEVGYITRPSAFSKYSNSIIEDAFDLAKAFVSSLTYGMTRSSYSRGQITMISRLLEVLVSGGWVGPVSAIGEDYKVLELKHVVEVKWGNRKGRTGYNMRLLKKEVGELALKAITYGDVSEQSLINFPSATVSKFISPEENRERIRRRQIKRSPKSTNDMLMVLRTGGL